MTGWTNIGAVDLTNPVQGALVMASDRRGRVLLQLRDDRPDVVWPGLWSLFGGAIEAGETAEQAALREFHEETGVELRDADLNGFARVTSTAGRKALLHVFQTDCQVEPENIRLGEGAGFGFFEPEMIQKLAIVPTQHPVLTLWQARHA